jgi:hypothetical protein
LANDICILGISPKIQPILVNHHTQDVQIESVCVQYYFVNNSRPLVEAHLQVI